MNLRALNHWLTLAANIGVMAGIIFLAYEIQQNTLATQLDAATIFQSSYSDIEQSIYNDPEFAALLVKGRDEEPLTEVEGLRIWVFYNNVLRQWQVNHFLYLSGALSEGMWDGNQAFMARVFAEDIGLLSQWRASKQMYSPEFNDIVESITADMP
jgi:hypothetical protein